MKNIGLFLLHKRAKYPVEGIFYFIWYVYIATSLITKQKRKMKKVLLTAALVAVFGFAANAQTDQGGWVVGGSTNIDFSSTSNDGDSQSTFGIDIKGGYFLMDNLAAGLNIGYVNVSDVASSSAFGPFARYYFNGTFYAGAGIDFASVKPDGGDSVSGTWINLEAGYPVFLTDNVAFEPNLSYAIGGGDLNEDLSRFGVNFGFFLYF